ncbi:30S ribosomal protein S16 [Candidatus Dojkabacteria bacterium]|jgi:small subunit ribosomal protein S16|nr:30S ribosomal protein S16 [Candidatus Dojkabacteria bacterium]
MLKIRLKRIGKKGQAFYRVVVMESTKARSSNSVADLGSYNPHTKPVTFSIDEEKAKYWMSKGAQTSDTVTQYFVKAGLLKAPRKGSVQSKGATKKKEAKKE